MNVLKYIAIALTVAGTCSSASAQGKKLASTLAADGLALESGLIAYERDIKFNYQQHADDVTEYSIAFFENADISNARCGPRLHAGGIAELLPWHLFVLELRDRLSKISAPEVRNLESLFAKYYRRRSNLGRIFSR